MHISYYARTIEWQPISRFFSSMGMMKWLTVAHEIDQLYIPYTVVSDILIKHCFRIALLSIGLHKSVFTFGAIKL